MVDTADVNTSIQDVNLTGGALQQLEGIEQISQFELQEAARQVVRAAAEARVKEFRELPLGRPVQEIDSAYEDTATGESYIRRSSGEWTNRGRVVPDPTVPDESQYEWVVERFEYFHERYPGSARLMAQACEDAKTAIQSGRMTAIQGVVGAVGDWGGRAQRNFTDYFLNPFANAVTNQQGLLDELAVGMYAYEAILRSARVDAKQLADATVNVLDSLHDKKGADAQTVLTVLGIAVSVVSTVATGGSTLGITLGLIGAGLSATQAVVDASQDVSGGTVDEVLRKLDGALDNLRTAMDAEEENLGQGLATTVGEVNSLLSHDSVLEKATILPNEPDGDGVTNLTGGEVPDSDEFGPD